MKNLEDLIRDTYGSGRSQAIVIGLATLPRISMGWSMLTMSFANFVPKWCCLPDNLTAISEELYCRGNDSLHNTATFTKRCWVNTTTCNNRIFDSSVLTIVNEWDLVCEKKWMVPLIASIQMFGVMVGAMISGQMADLVGRKKTIYLNTALCTVFNLVASFSTVWEMFAVFRFFIGMSIGGYLATSVPYNTEFVLSARRAIVSTIPAFQVGSCLLALVAWRTQDWKMVHWICAAMTLPFLLGYLIVPESLRWLTVSGRVEEAQKVVEWIARWNKQVVPKDSLDVIKAVAAESSNSAKSTKYTYISIYKGRHLFKTSIILQFLWFTGSLSTYGLSFGLSSFGTNMYLNIFIFSLTSIPNLLTVSFIIDRIGRKKTAILFFTLSSLCGFGTMVVKLTLATWGKQVLTGIILNMLMRTFIASAWSATNVITNEVYPTIIRGLGYGACNVIARIGGILAPFALNFEDNPVMAQVIMGVTLLMAALGVIFLDETTGKAMQDTIIVPDNINNIELKAYPENGNGPEDVTSSNDTSSYSTTPDDAKNSAENLELHYETANGNNKTINNDSKKTSSNLHGIENTAFTEKL